MQNYPDITHIFQAIVYIHGRGCSFGDGVDVDGDGDGAGVDGDTGVCGLLTNQQSSNQPKCSLVRRPFCSSDQQTPAFVGGEIFGGGASLCKVWTLAIGQNHFLAS